MAPDIVLGVGATAPVLRVQLKDPTGNLVPITGATGIIRIRDINHTRAEIVAPVFNVDEPQSIVGYDWQSSDTAIADWYRVRIEMTLASGKMMPWPDDRRWLLQVTPRP